jgi:putative transposase
MPQIARVVAPGVPHHVTQRGNRRQPTFFRDKDYDLYLELLGENCDKFDVELTSYSLMPNHVHHSMIPEDEIGLSKAVGETHKKYTKIINAREGWSGFLWQGRFASFPMDDAYHMNAVRYIELNPVAAGIVEDPGLYRWSSAAVHLTGKPNGLVDPKHVLEIIPDWQAFLQEGISRLLEDDILAHGKSGLPLGSEEFVRKLEKQLGRPLTQRPEGRPRKEN